MRERESFSQERVILGQVSKKKNSEWKALTKIILIKYTSVKKRSSWISPVSVQKALLLMLYFICGKECTSAVAASHNKDEKERQ